VVNEYRISRDREKLKFMTDVEIEVHKLISSLCYGQQIEIDIGNDKKTYVKAVKKSAFYNCMDTLKIVHNKKRKSITVKIEI
jgi:hypothetical protein